MSEELRPCPFCGKIPKPDWTDESYIECTNRKCSVYSFGVSTGSWNTRPIEDALNKRITELEEERVVWLNGAENIVKRLSKRITELKLIIDKLVEGIDSLTSEFPLEIEYIEAIEIAKDWKEG